MKVYDMMHYDALNLGRREFTYGLDYLQKASNNAKFPFLAANLVDRKTQQPLFQRYVIKTFGEKSTLGIKHSGVRVGIFGVASMDAGRSMGIDDKEKVEFLDPISTAEGLVAELSRTCDMIIGMGNMDMSEARKLTSQVKGIHLFLISGNMRRLYQPEILQDTGTILLKAAARGKKVGEIVATFDVKQQKITTQDGKLVSIDDKLAQDKEIEALVREAKRKGSEITREIRRKTQAQKENADARDLPDFRPTYIGAEACSKCHKDVVERWRNTKHAHAMATLAKMSKQNDPSCVRCHSTGYTDSGGYLNEKETPQLADVRCEACHGPASMHLDNSRIRLRKPTLQVCKACHTVARSRPLDWQKDKLLVH
ncbi:MAG: hypothetical protein JW941_13440 [Candidatus Coatesbacteria bacterium]|nr:hypothetical protein [Candidatus Coatesbacteria bacterium]